MQGDTERRPAGLANTALACRCIRARKEGQDGAGMTGTVAKVKVIGRRIVEVDGLLDKAQPEVARVKSQVPDRITADRGHVMDSWHVWLLMACFPSFSLMRSKRRRTKQVGRFLKDADASIAR